jgi:spore maturation protein CgeB
MSFRLLIISSLYKEYLHTYYEKHADIKKLSYSEQYEHILNDTSEPAGSYTKMFKALGLEARVIFENAIYLQNKWALEDDHKGMSGKKLVFRQIQKFNPDIIWIENINYLEQGWISLLRTSVPALKLVLASHCAPYNSEIIERFKNLDFIITCTPGLKQEFVNNGLKTHFVYHAFNPDVLKKISAKSNISENEFVFSGSLFMGGGYHDSRLKLVEKILEEELDLKIYGNLESLSKIHAKRVISQIIRLFNKFGLQEVVEKNHFLRKYIEYGRNPVSVYSEMLKNATKSPFFGMDMFTLLSRSKIILNIHGEVAGEYAGNMRLFEATGVGSCLLTDNKNNMNDLFAGGSEVVVYDNFDDCIEKAKWLLTNEKDRAGIAKKGQKRTLENHTVENRCKQIVEILSKELRNKI